MTLSFWVIGIEVFRVHLGVPVLPLLKQKPAKRLSGSSKQDEHKDDDEPQALGFL